jgi:hypothetical protein
MMRRLKILLRALLALGGVLLTARAAVGPFRLLHIAVNNPIPLESVVAVCGVALIAMESRPGGKRDSDAWRRGDWWALALLCAVGVMAWVRCVWFPFVADDYVHIGNALRATPAYLKDLFLVPAADRFFRPMGLLAYAAEARLWGANRLAWHAASICMHIANSGLVYRLCRTRWMGPMPALCAASFFLLNGSRPEAVTWISAQFDALATLFFLLALLALERGVRSRRWQWQALSAVALLAALLSKESAYVFPFVAMLALWSQGVPGRRTVRLIAAPLLLTIGVFAYRWMLLEGIGGYRTAGSGQSYFYSVDLLRTSKALLLRPPAILMFPLNWSVPPEWWVTMLLGVVIVAWGVLSGARANRAEIAFALGWLLVCEAPVHQFLLIDANLEKARVLYLPSIGMALLLGAAFSALRQRVLIAAAGAIIAFQAAALEHNLTIWKGVARYAEDTCAEAARQLEQASGTVLVSDVPNDIDGVYFLHTGLRACIGWAGGREAPNLVIEGEPGAEGVKAARTLRWENAQRRWQIMSGAAPVHR